MKNKKIIIPTILIIVILLLGTVAYLYLKTDTFKSNKQLFYKYLLSNNSQQEAQGKINNLNKKLNGSNYSSTGNIKLSYGANSGTAGVANLQEIFNIAYQSNKNNQTKQDKTAIDFKLNNQSFVKANYLRSDNTYGLSLDNVTNKYLAVENANLKELFRKLGVTDTSKIPDSIPEINLEDLLKIDEETANRLKDTYMNIIDKNISDNKYIKTKNADGTKTMSLSLTDTELLNLAKNILETAENDGIILRLISNKLKDLEFYVTPEKISIKIREIIDRLQDVQTQNTEILKIEVTKTNKRKTKTSEVDVTTYPTINTKVTINSNKDTIIINNTLIDNPWIGSNITNITKENNSESANENINVQITTNVTNQNIGYGVYISSGSSENTIFQMNIDLNDNSESIIGKVYIGANVQDTIVELRIDEDITFANDLPIEQLTTANSVKLNDMSSEELMNLLNALQKRVVALYGNQIASMSMGYSALQRAQSAADKMEKNLEKEQQAVEAYEREMNQLQQR